MYRTDFWTLWEKVKVGWSERIASKYVYYQVWNRSPVQVGCMRQVLGPGALGRPRGMGWGIHVNPWLIHVYVWQKPLQYCEVISLKLIKINEKKKKKNTEVGCQALPQMIIWTQGSNSHLLSLLEMTRMFFSTSCTQGAIHQVKPRLICF